jgi:5-methyltetrahydrofolate--homocysteine methyltransferase
MRVALDTRPRGERPTLEQVVAALGDFSSPSDGTEPGAAAAAAAIRSRRGGRRRG